MASQNRFTQKPGQKKKKGGWSDVVHTSRRCSIHTFHCLPQKSWHHSNTWSPPQVRWVGSLQHKRHSSHQGRTGRDKKEKSRAKHKDKGLLAHGIYQHSTKETEQQGKQCKEMISGVDIYEYNTESQTIAQPKHENFKSCVSWQCVTHLVTEQPQVFVTSIS